MMQLAWPRLEQAAWTQIWQVTALALAALLLVRTFCRSRPHLAYLFWMLVIIKCLTPPIWSSPTGIFSWAGATTTPPTPRLAVNVEKLEAAGATIENPRALSRKAVDTDRDSPAAPPVRTQSAERMRLSTVLGIVWLGGFLMFAGFALARRAACYRSLRRRQVAAGESMIDLVDDISRRLGITRKVGLVVTSEPFGPAVYGLLRPTVLLPEPLVRERPVEQLKPILAHELIHIRRHDLATGAVQAFAQMLWWFHPLVWWANREMCRERERCCDEETVAALGCNPADYAQGLLDVVKLKRQLRTAFDLPGVRAAEVTSRRLEHIMNHRGGFHQRMPRAYWLVLALALLLVLPGARIMVQASQPPVSALPAEDDRRVEAEPVGTPLPQARRVTAIEKLGGTVEFDTTRPEKPVTLVSFDSINVTDDDLALLEGLTEVRRFGCFGSPVTDAGLAHLAHLEKLELLVLSETKVTDRGLAHLKGLANLERLFLSNTQINGEGLIHLKDFPNLMHLELSSCPVTDASLVHLKGLNALERLDLTHVAGVNGSFLEHLKELKNLKSLVLRYSHITDEALEKVGPLSNVQGMQLDETDVSDEGLEHLIAWPNLEKLGLDAEQFTLLGVAHLEKMPQLRALDLHSVDSATVPLLELLRNLREVNFLGGHVNEAGFEALTQLPNLASVGFNGSLLEDADLRRLAEAESLRTVRLVGSRYTDETLSHITFLPQIDSLGLYGTNVTGNGLRHVEAMSNLASLDLRESARINDAALEHLKNLKNLKHLNLGDGTQVTEPGVESLQKALPAIKIDYRPTRRDAPMQASTKDVSSDVRDSRRNEAENPSPFSVAGTVTDQDGRPLAGVEVVAYCGVGTLRRTGQTLTDESGGYRLRFTPGMVFTGRPWGAGFQAATIYARKASHYEINLCRQGDLAMADEILEQPRRHGYEGVVLPHKPYRLDFVMAPAATVEVRLVDAKGNPLGDRKFWISGDELPPSSSVLANCVADDDGSFTLTEVPLGSFWFLLRTAEGREVRSEAIEFANPGRHKVELAYDGRDGEVPLLEAIVTSAR